MKIIASLNLLESGNLEFEGAQIWAFRNKLMAEKKRLAVICGFWDNPELQALLDRFIAADIGGVPFE
jgi:hypothetical protein